MDSNKYMTVLMYEGMDTNIENTMAKLEDNSISFITRENQNGDINICVKKKDYDKYFSFILEHNRNDSVMQEGFAP